ncbi:hypothetical protein [Streptomyces sp. NPDC002209]|uniref:hypothetical protein n=1 Tax=Streptomyces sp. NPDC002209 TaxID=3364638 RepID=UPI0036A7D04D
MHRITRYTLPAALCVTLLSASPGLAGAANAPARPSAPVAKKSIPGTEALTAQVQALGSAGVLITPVTNFLGEVLKSPDGKLPEADLAAHKQKIDAALSGLKQTFAAVAPAAPVVLPKPPAEVAKPPVEAAKPPAEVAKPPAEVAKPPAEVAKPPVDAAKPVEAAKPPAEVAKPPADVAKPVEVAKPPAEVAKPPVDVAKPVEVAKPPAEVAKPPVDVAKPVEAAKPPAEVAKPVDMAKPVTLPAAVPAPLPAVAPVSARAARAGAPLDLVAAAVDHLKASVDEVAKAAGPCGCTTDAKDKATDVVNDLGTTVVALFTGLGLPGMPAAAPAPAPDPAE